MSYRYYRATKPLRLLQINIGKKDTSHDLVLALAYEKKIDVLLVQKLYIYYNNEYRITKCHQSYEYFIPTDDWLSRPRVLIYLRKGIGLQAKQA
jgi:hypothetical protein